MQSRPLFACLIKNTATWKVRDDVKKCGSHLLCTSRIKFRPRHRTGSICFALEICLILYNVEVKAQNLCRESLQCDYLRSHKHEMITGLEIRYFRPTSKTQSFEAMPEPNQQIAQQDGVFQYCKKDSDAMNLRNHLLLRKDPSVDSKTDSYVFRADESLYTNQSGKNEMLLQTIKNPSLPLHIKSPPKLSRSIERE